MNASLTPGQRAQLQELLELRQHELDRRVAAHLGTQGRTDREIDLAQADREMDELGAVSRALARLHQPGYGLCVDCSAAIPFDRLKVEPWATRCVACEGAREGSVVSPRL
jgi:DnaK suppressor protein